MSISKCLLGVADFSKFGQIEAYSRVVVEPWRVVEENTEEGIESEICTSGSVQTVQH